MRRTPRSAARLATLLAALAPLAPLVALAVLAPACSRRAASPPAGPTQLVWVDFDGKPGATLGSVHLDIRDPELSPDGTPATFTAGASGEELWSVDPSTGDETRLPPGAGSHAQPRGFAAGRPLVNSTLRSDLHLVLVTPDGRSVIVVADVDGHSRLRVAAIGANAALGDLAPILKRANEPDVVDASLSADGTLLAYEIKGEQRHDVFMTRFPSGEGEWQVSDGGGVAPRFAARAKELFYVARPDSGPQVMNVVEVYADETPPFGRSRPGFDVGAIPSLAHPTEFVVTPDGQRFLFAQRRPVAGARPDPAANAR